MNWLHEIPLSNKATAIRGTLSVSTFSSLQLSIEHLAMSTQRPIAEVAERLLTSYWAMVNGDGPDEFLSLLVDIYNDHDGQP